MINLLSFYIITFYQYFIYLFLFYHSILHFIITMFDLSGLICTVHLESSHCVSDAPWPHCARVRVTMRSKFGKLFVFVIICVCICILYLYLFVFEFTLRV